MGLPPTLNHVPYILYAFYSVCILNCCLYFTTFVNRELLVSDGLQVWLRMYDSLLLCVKTGPLHLAYKLTEPGIPNFTAV